MTVRRIHPTCPFVPPLKGGGTWDKDVGTWDKKWDTVGQPDIKTLSEQALARLHGGTKNGTRWDKACPNTPPEPHARGTRFCPCCGRSVQSQIAAICCGQIQVVPHHA